MDAQGLILSVRAAERAAIDAALSGSRAMAIKALALHPLVPSVDVAGRILDGYLAGQPALVEQFGARLRWTTDRSPARRGRASGRIGSAISTSASRSQVPDADHRAPGPVPLGSATTWAPSTRRTRLPVALRAGRVPRRGHRPAGQEIVIGESDATPGCLAGPIPAGPWSLVVAAGRDPQRWGREPVASTWHLEASGDGSRMRRDAAAA